MDRGGKRSKDPGGLGKLRNGGALVALALVTSGGIPLPGSL